MTPEQPHQRDVQVIKKIKLQGTTMGHMKSAHEPGPLQISSFPLCLLSINLFTVLIGWSSYLYFKEHQKRHYLKSLLKFLNFKQFLL